MRIHLFHQLCILGMLLWAFAAPSLAQTPKSIHITDADGRDVPRLGMTVQLCGQTFRLRTDNQGTATLPQSAETGCTEARIQISSKLYAPLDTLIRIAGSSTPWQIVLRPAEKTLREVNVVAYQKIAQNDAEKSVYRIDPRAFLKTSKADEALNFLPGVEAERGQYTLVGRDRTARLKINGEPASKQELQALRISEIEHVEVREITKDDNDRFAGEINIVKKRHEQPLFNATLQTWTGTIHHQLGTYDDFNFQNKHWDIRAFVNLLRSHQDNTTHLHRNYLATDGSIISTQTMTNNAYISVWQESEGLKAAWFPNKKLTLNVALSHSTYGGETDQHIYDFDQSAYMVHSKDKMETFNAYANAKYALNDKNRLLLKTAFTYYRTPYTFSTHPEYNYKSAMRNYTIEIGSEHRIKLLGGTHDITSALRNTTRQNITSSGGTETYSIQQLSLTDVHSFNKQLSYFLILKGETDNQGGRRFTSFQPQLRLNYNLPYRTTLSATYERRVMRPSIKFLNSDTLMNNLPERIVGNNQLEAMHSDALILSFKKQIKGSYLTTTLNLNRTAKLIDQIYLDDTDYNVTTYANIGNCRSATLSVNYTRRLCNHRMNLSVTARGFYKHYDIASPYEDNALIVPSAGWGWNTTLNMSYLSTRNWIYSLQVTYKPKEYALAQIMHKHPQFNGMIQKNILKDKVSLSLVYLCPFVYCVTERSEYNLRHLQQRKDFKIGYSNITFSIALNIGKWFRQRSVTHDATSDDINL